uniref:Tenascin C n=1 Tax=Eptatretus burgeri TaxID=7764 RepID=A0A8C4QLL7_EPTBU
MYTTSKNFRGVTVLLLLLSLARFQARVVEVSTEEKEYSAVQPSADNMTRTSKEKPLVFNHVYNINLPMGSVCNGGVDEMSESLHDSNGADTFSEHTQDQENQVVFTHRINIPRKACACPSCTDHATEQQLLRRIEALENQISEIRLHCLPGHGCCDHAPGMGSVDSSPICNGHGNFTVGTCDCVCEEGWTGPNCSQPFCLDNCNEHGHCVDGQCVCFESYSGVACSTENCINNCNNHGQCKQGICVCFEGFHGESCADKSCPGDCNGHGHCTDGQCTCFAGFTGKTCSDISCPGDCSDHGMCVKGSCICHEYFSGEDCSERHCPEDCTNGGICVDGRCVCLDGFSGQTCTAFACPGDCHDQGLCENGHCNCFEGYSGYDCSIRSCPKDCNDRGHCIESICFCSDDYSGDDCGDLRCNADCSGHGQCEAGVCHCESGYEGEDCGIEVECPNECNDQGRCQDGHCVCYFGYTGPDCSIIPCPGQCSGHGECVAAGKCICQVGYFGEDCSQTNCLNDCGVHGFCLNGECHCDNGFIGHSCTSVIPPQNLTVMGVTEEAVDVIWQGHPVATGYLVTYEQTPLIGTQMEVHVPNSVTQAKLIGLAPGIVYLIHAYSLVNSFVSAPASTHVYTYNVSDRLPRPVGLHFTSVKEHEMTVQWDPYPLPFEMWEVSFYGSEGRVVTQLPNDEMSFVQNELQTGQEYSVSLVVHDGDDRSLPATATVFTVVGKPIEFAVRDAHETYALLTWTKPEGHIDGYRLTSGFMGEAERLENELSANVTEFTLQDLLPGHTYEVMLWAEKGPRQSHLVQEEFTTALDSPKNLRVVAQAEESLTLEWDNSQAKVDGYHVLYTTLAGGEHGSFNISHSLQGTTNVTISDLLPGTEYGIGVRGYRARMQSKPTTINTRTELDSPKQLTVTDTTDTTLTISWLPCRAWVDRYELIYNSSEDMGKLVLNGSVESVTLHDLQPDTEYTLALHVERGSDRSRSIMTTGNTETSVEAFLLRSTPSPIMGFDVLQPRPEEHKKGDKDRDEEMSAIPEYDDLHEEHEFERLEGEEEKNTDRSDHDVKTEHKEVQENFNIGVVGQPETEDEQSREESQTVEDGENTVLGIIEGRGEEYEEELHRSEEEIEDGHEIISEEEKRNGMTKKEEPETIGEQGQRFKGEISVLGMDHEREDDEGEETGETVLEGDGEGTGSEFENEDTFGTASTQIEDQLHHEANNNLFIYSTDGKHGEKNKDEEGDHGETQKGIHRVTVEHEKDDEEEENQLEVQVFGAGGAETATDGAEELDKEKEETAEQHEDQKMENERAEGQPVQDIVEKHQIIEEGQGMDEVGVVVGHDNVEDATTVEIPKDSVFRMEVKGKDTDLTSESGDHDRVTNDTRVVLTEDFYGRIDDQKSEKPDHIILTSSGQGSESEAGQGTEATFQDVTEDSKHMVGVISNIDEIVDGTNMEKEKVIDTEKDGKIIETEDERQDGSNVEEPTSDGHGGVVTGFSEEGQPENVEDVTQKKDSEKGGEEADAGEKEEYAVAGVLDEKEGLEDSKEDANIHASMEEVQVATTEQGAGLPATDQTVSAVLVESAFEEEEDGHEVEETEEVELEMTTEMDLVTPLPGVDTGVEPEQSHTPGGSAVWGPSDGLIFNNVTSNSVTISWQQPKIVPDHYQIACIPKAGGTEDVIQLGPLYTEYTIVDLLPATEYAVTVIAIALGRKNKPISGMFFTALDGPAILSSVNIYSTEAELKWAAGNSDADYYIVMWSNNATGGQVKISGSIHEYTLYDLEPGTDYVVSVHSKKEQLESAKSYTRFSTVLDSPRGLAYVNVTENLVLVTWEASAPEPDAYRLSFTSSDGDHEGSFEITPPLTSYTLVDLTPATEYEIALVSVKRGRESNAVYSIVTTAMDCPSTLNVLNVTATDALLVWTPTIAKTESYFLIISTDDEPISQVEVPGKTTHHYLFDLEPTTTYDVSLHAIHRFQESKTISVIFTTGISSPHDLEVTEITRESALVSWHPPSAEVSGYLLLCESDRGEVQEHELDKDETSMRLEDLSRLTKHTVTIQSILGRKYSAPVTTHFTTERHRYVRPSDCTQHALNGEESSGVFTIYISGNASQPLLVFCDMETDGGGWIVFQRRQNGRTDFFRDWKSYVTGFGDLNDEFWLGLDNLHRLTAQGHKDLRVDLRDGPTAVFAVYNDFTVGNGRTKYRLKLGKYHGTAGDSMTYHSGRPFSAPDRDNDIAVTNCATSYKGAWWYKNCHRANLNGKFGEDNHSQGINWYHWKGHEQSIPFVEMKMREHNVDMNHHKRRS